MREGCMATRGCVVSLSVHGPQIALGDSRDGVLFLRFRPETRDFEVKGGGAARCDSAA